MGLTWALICFVVVYTIGAVFGGVRGGLEMVGSVLATLAFYACAAALLFYTIVAIASVIA
jgi:hypothetical protein